MSRIQITARVEPDGKPMTIVGRAAWALLALVAAGSRGCTPITTPGPRWAAYVFKLRSKHGLVIETIDEEHTGPFAGRHARYVLHSDVTILEAAPARQGA